MTFKDWGNNFQTPDIICEDMVSMVQTENPVVFEPTPGQGKLLRKISEKMECIAFPGDDIFRREVPEECNVVIMNPPFTPAKNGYDILFKMMDAPSVKEIITIMPWLTLINGMRRTKAIEDWGICRVVHLPRDAFKKSRAQTCIMHMVRGFSGQCLLDFFDKERLNETS